MAISGIKEILVSGKTEDDTILNQRSEEINIVSENKEMRKIISELKRTMRKLGLTSLSAPAIGYNKRIFCIDFKDEEIKTFINPIIVSAEGLHLSKEICSSLPGKQFIRPRNNDIKVMYQTPLQKPESRQFLGLAADVFQHELDHLDGLLLCDIGLEIDDDFENAPEEERQEVIEAYLDSLDLRSKQLDKEIQETPELKKVSDAIDFMTSVKLGETKLEQID